jgi:hypothetical protein
VWGSIFGMKEQYLEKKRQFFSNIFGENISKITTLGTL